MARRREQPKLVLERAEWRNGKIARPPSWVIRDGGRKVRTGCRETEVEKARQCFADYLVAAHTPARERNRTPDQVLIADVVAVYSEDVAGRHARPQEAAARLGRVLDHFGEKKLSAVTGAACRAYAEARGSKASARRELEELRAAINHYFKEGFVSAPVAVTLPDKSEARTRWLNRSEAARLISAAWRLKQSWKGHESDRHTAKHVARFILVALYTGSRAGAVCGAAIRPTVGRGYVDLDRGVFYRRPPGQRETKKRQPIDCSS
jgi:integrase